MNRLTTGLALVCLAGLAPAQDYRFETLNDELNAPWCVAFLPDDGFLVTELPGTLKRLSPDGAIVAEIEGVPAVHHASQGGLFDVALHPGFAENGLIYLSYAEPPAKENATAVFRARLDGSVLRDAEVIYRVKPRKDTPVHYGGRLLFLPDGSLLLTTGDGFDFREAAQDLGSHLGKVIRLTESGEPAPGNPFPKSPYVWTYGHRNPQGLALSSSGVVYLHEHGPRGGDELNVFEKAVNYGWPAITHGVDYSGALVSPFTEWEGMAQPAHHWTPSIAPSGLAVYEGDEFPQWTGDLFVGGLVSRDVRRLELDHAGTVTAEHEMFSELETPIRDVRFGTDRRLYLLTDGTPGALLRIVPR